MVNHTYFIPLVTLAVMLLMSVAEWLHRRRVKRLKHLAFGPKGTPHRWTAIAGPLRVVAVGAVVCGLLLLSSLSQSHWDSDWSSNKQNPIHHVVVALDVSPSMQIVDAGPNRKQTRADRAREVLRSALARIDTRRGQVSVIAFYTEARLVVVDTFDPAVVHNILNDLPLEQAFEPGKTNLHSVISKSAELAKTWPIGSASLIVVSDGDTLPAETPPKRSRSYQRVLVLGVGDPYRGTFIHDHSSRQDRRSLTQLAARMHGEYIDVNQNHIASDLLPSAPLKRDNGLLAWRQVALAAVAMGSAILALLPLALATFGGTWNPQRAPATYLTRNHFDREPA